MALISLIIRILIIYFVLKLIGKGLKFLFFKAAKNIEKKAYEASNPTPKQSKGDVFEAEYKVVSEDK